MEEAEEEGVEKYHEHAVHHDAILVADCMPHPLAGHRPSGFQPPPVL
jgi:hypothetical protein